MLVRSRDPTADLRVLTASHCIFDLADASHAHADLEIELADGSKRILGHDAIEVAMRGGSLSSRRQAVVMDFAFLPIGPSASPAVSEVPPELLPRSAVTLQSVIVDGPERRYTCHVQTACGTQIFLDRCRPAVVKGVSGSAVWTVRNGMPVVVGLITDEQHFFNRATATSYASILAKSSFLTADPRIKDHDLARTAFVDRYMGQAKYRLPEDPTSGSCRSNGQTQVDASRPAADDASLWIGAAFGASGELVSWNATRKALCAMLPGQTPQCGKVEFRGLGQQSVRGITWLADSDYLLRLSAGGALLLKHETGPSLWTTERAIDASQEMLPTSQTGRVITNQVEGGFRTSTGDLILYGEGGTCVVSGSGCHLVKADGKPRESAQFTARSAFEIAPGRVLAVGRDFRNGEVPQCVLLEKNDVGWRITKFCYGLPDDLRGINAALPLDGRALLFSSSGAILELDDRQRAKRIPIEGLMATPLGASNEFDDAIRTARWVQSGRLLALSGSDGAFHLVQVKGTPGRLSAATGRCLSKVDLGLWLVAMDVQAKRAAVVSQAGELRMLEWQPSKLQAFLDRPYNGTCT